MPPLKQFCETPWDKISLFVVDDQTVVGRVQDVITANCDLRVDLPVAVLGSVKHEIAIYFARITALLPLAIRAFFIKAGVTNWPLIVSVRTGSSPAVGLKQKNMIASERSSFVMFLSGCYYK